MGNSSLGFVIIWLDCMSEKFVESRCSGLAIYLETVHTLDYIGTVVLALKMRLICSSWWPTRLLRLRGVGRNFIWGGV